MSAPKPELQGSSVVLIGSFNPLIVQPSWLAQHDLIRADEAQRALEEKTIRVVHPELCAFEVDWLNIEITQKRFMASTASAEHKPALVDLVEGIFSLLSHSPISAMGLNADWHYKVATEEDWHRAGHYFLPKAPFEEVVENPGMQAVRIWGTRPNGCGARLQIDIQPSQRVKHGVYFGFNEHYSESDLDKRQSFIDAMRVQWTDVQKYTADASAKLLREALA